ncbi:hypothetical protein [Streptomyces sp. NPDC048623]|uniref:hypothetical protein n=1 Tax=Streptomyces sp. NPDC048623 TaxID=3155761 RepID=UPI0034271895
MALAICLALFPTSNAFAGESGAEVMPEIVSDEQYLADGNVDPKTIDPVIEVSQAAGTEVDAFAALLGEVSGLTVSSAPTAENYGELGQALVVDLTSELGAQVSVTRVAAKTDIPQSTLSDDGAQKSLSVLPNGSQLMSSLSPETGAMVSTLSRNGQLTVWNDPHATTEDDLTRITRWATAVDSRQPEAVEVHTAATSSQSESIGIQAVAAARPSCYLTLQRPYTQYGRVEVSNRLLCDQNGLIKLDTSIEQYRGLWIWARKAVNAGQKENISYIWVTASWKCAAGTGNQLYRSRVIQRSLRNSNGVWYETTAIMGPQQRLTCG